MLEMHVVFKGRVQGVGFRYRVSHYAKALSLSGTVKNLPDGNVDLIAQGTKESLDRLLDLLDEAFPGHILDKEIEFSAPAQIFPSFSIL